MNKTEKTESDSMIKQKTPQKNDKTENAKNRTKKRKKNKKIKNINLLYSNPEGITGKITSLIAAAQATDAHIIGLAETKIGKVYPAVQGYTWANKPRTNKGGAGGVAILIRDDIKSRTEQVEGLEDHDQEIV